MDDTVLLKHGLSLEKRIRLKRTNSIPTEKGGDNENGSFFPKTCIYLSEFILHYLTGIQVHITLNVLFHTEMDLNARVYVTVGGRTDSITDRQTDRRVVIWSTMLKQVLLIGGH